MTFFSKFSAAALACAAALASLGDVQAQSPFTAAIRVDDAIVTNYEIDQRIRFLEVLNAQGDLRGDAIEALINERLQQAEGLRLGVAADPEAIDGGVEEFAGRANLGAEQFIRQMGSEGIAPETIRDFIATGITWRNIVRNQFGSQARVSDAEIDRAMEIGTSLGGGLEILLAEIIIPVTPQNQANLESELARLGRDVSGNIERFSEAARRFSAAPTRDEGGITGWRPITSIPEGLRQMFLDMSPGQVSRPVPLGGGQAFAIFQFRGEREVTAPPPTITEIDYVTIAIPGGQSEAALTEAARLDAAVDTCNDFNGVIPGGFERQSVAPGQIEQDIALALRNLDDHEMSTQVTRNGGSVLLAVMLCDRVLADPEGGRAAVRERLFQQRLESLAAGYLEELRANANIRFLN